MDLNIADSHRWKVTRISAMPIIPIEPAKDVSKRSRLFWCADYESSRTVLSEMTSMTFPYSYAPALSKRFIQHIFDPDREQRILAIAQVHDTGRILLLQAPDYA